MTTKADQRVSDTPRTDAISTYDSSQPHSIYDERDSYQDEALSLRDLARTLEHELVAARRDIKEAMGYAAHHGGCAEYHGAGEDCVCGLDAQRERIAKEGMRE